MHIWNYVGTSQCQATEHTDAEKTHLGVGDEGYWPVLLHNSFLVRRVDGGAAERKLTKDCPSPAGMMKGTMNALEEERQFPHFVQDVC